MTIFNNTKPLPKHILKSKQRAPHSTPTGTSTQVRLKESTYQDIQEIQKKLREHLGTTPSMPLIIRRSLSTYIRAVQRMDAKGMSDEAYILKEHFRG